MNPNLEPNASAIAVNERICHVRDTLAAELLEGASAREVATRLADETDRWVTQLWAAAGGADANLIAVGGQDGMLRLFDRGAKKLLWECSPGAAESP